MISQTHKLDVVPGGVTAVVHVKQYQTGESLVFELFSRFGDFEISAAFTECTVRGTKSDGNGYSANATCDPSNNSVTVQLTEQMTAVAGRQPYEITITESTGRMITTTFILDVHRAALDADTVESESVIREVGTIVEEYLEGGAADDIIDAAVEGWLDNHPEATTTVEPNSITEPKINSEFLPYIKNDYVTPEMFGAVGDGVTNDAPAIQSALNVGGLIRFESPQYKITGPLRVKADTYMELGGSTLDCSDNHIFYNFLPSDTSTGYDGNGNISIRNGTIIGGCISFAHGENILVENMTFKNCLNDHFIEICACKNYVVRNCTLTGMRFLQDRTLEYINIDPCVRTAFPHFAQGNETPYDGTINSHIVIDGNVFKRGTGDWDNMWNGAGVHYFSEDYALNEDVSLINNYVEGSDRYGLSVAGCSNSRIENNRIITNNRGVRVGYGDSNVIKNNVIVINKNTSAVGFSAPVTNIVIDGNIVESLISGDKYGRYIIGESAANISASTFLVLQRTIVDITSDASQELSYPFTLFTGMYLFYGANGSGTWTEQHIVGYYGRTFETGTARFVQVLDANGAMTPKKVTFDSTNTKLVTFDQAPRLLEVETRLTRSQ